MRHRLALPMLALSMLAACGNAAAQQVRHCVAADGSLVYTDKTCETVGAVELPPPAHALPGFSRAYRNACVRDLQAFVHELSSAIEVNDVNRLSGLYWWSGIPGSASGGLMRRLEEIAARPLLQVVPVPGDQAPTALRLDQTLSDGVTPASTLLQLQHGLGCWWVTL